MFDMRGCEQIQSTKIETFYLREVNLLEQLGRHSTKVDVVRTCWCAIEVVFGIFRLLFEPKGEVDVFEWCQCSQKFVFALNRAS